MPDEKYIDFPPLSLADDLQPVRQTPQEVTPQPEITDQTRIDHAIAIVRTHHERIAKSLVIIWGHKECADYLQRLIVTGNDSHQAIRAGFRPEVLAALLNLSRLHKVTKR